MTINSVAILHLSDLHLGESIDDIGTESSDAMRTVKNLWSNGGLKMQAHDPFILTSLHTDVKSAARRTGRDAFNLLVVTGDISTNANSEQRFLFAKDFLTSSLNNNGFKVGLEFPGDSTLCVPGNHDKMNESSCTRYLEHFGGLPSNSLPYTIEKTVNGMRFIFYGIDSNLYQEGNVAKGIITEPTLAWLKEQKNKAEEDIQLPKPIRILLLHHHPCDLNEFRGLGGRLEDILIGRLSRLDNGERILKVCNGWVDVIMHGHEHFPITFRDKTSGAVVISAGTTSERHKKNNRNSFYSLLFVGRKLMVSEYRWNGGLFKWYSDKHWQLN